jgi:hypothetical protein
MISCMRNQVYTFNKDTINHYFGIGDRDRHSVSIYGAHMCHTLFTGCTVTFTFITTSQ